MAATLKQILRKNRRFKAYPCFFHETNGGINSETAIHQETQAFSSHASLTHVHQ